MFQALKVCSKLCSRRAFTTSTKKFRTFEEFKELQRQMQVDDGKLVWLKKGPVDKIYFSCIVLYTAVMSVYAGQVLYKIVYPPKNN